MPLSGFVGWPASALLTHLQHHRLLKVAGVDFGDGSDGQHRGGGFDLNLDRSEATFNSLATSIIRAAVPGIARCARRHFVQNWHAVLPHFSRPHEDGMGPRASFHCAVELGPKRTWETVYWLGMYSEECNNVESAR